MLYLTVDASIDEIVKSTGVSRSELYRITKRAFEARADGLPVGFLSCIPGYRLKAYTLVSQNPKQRAGRMQQFLVSHPELKKTLDDWALGHKKLNHSKLRGRSNKRLWQAFRDACREDGLDVDTCYPFTNDDGGREAVRRYVKTLRAQDFVANAKVVYGDESGRLAAANGINVPKDPVVPYERVQLDGHRLDAIFNVQFTDPQGNEHDLPLSRLWLIVLIDLGSRCVLGYSLSLSENYTAEDVLNCVGSALMPWTPKELPDRVDGYRLDAGLPSGVINQCAGRVFNTLQMDNAWSHLSATVQERILATGAVEVVTNRPRSPRSNSVIEKLMSTIESTSLHLWPNTTGSHPKDPKRRNPEKAAKALNLHLEQLETVVDLAIANYNVTAHDTLNGRSPMEYLRYRLSKGADLLRYAPQTSLDGLGLFDVEQLVTVRANLKKGHKPYIQFKNAHYSAPWLHSRFDLNKTQVRLRINSRDIRTGLLFLDCGECLGEVEVEPRWRDHAHTIATRRAIAKLVKAQKLVSDSHQPVLDYLDYLAKLAPLTRKARNKLLSNQRRAEQTTPVADSSSLDTARASSERTLRRGSNIKLTTTLSR